LISVDGDHFLGSMSSRLIKSEPIDGGW